MFWNTSKQNGFRLYESFGIICLHVVQTTCNSPRERSVVDNVPHATSQVAETVSFYYNNIFKFSSLVYSGKIVNCNHSSK